MRLVLDGQFMPLNRSAGLLMALVGLVQPICGLPSRADGMETPRPINGQDAYQKAQSLADSKQELVILVNPPPENKTGSDGIFVFYNNPVPFCYSYRLPSGWTSGQSVQFYRTTTGSDSLGVALLDHRIVAGFKGTDLIGRVAEFLATGYELRLPSLDRISATLTPFTNSSPRAWRFSMKPYEENGERIGIAPTYLVETPYKAIFVLTIGSNNSDSIAREIIASLRTTRTPSCYLGQVKRLLKSTPNPKRLP
ncbi:MAG: hypothetical protein WBM08_01105 [Prochlorococcaceae cyanobacterium]